MNEDNTDKVSAVLESSLSFTYKVRGVDELKIADSVSELLEGRDIRKVAGKEISIFCNGKRVGNINCDALLWSIMRTRRLALTS